MIFNFISQNNQENSNRRTEENSKTRVENKTDGGHFDVGMAFNPQYLSRTTKTATAKIRLGSPSLTLEQNNSR